MSNGNVATVGMIILCRHFKFRTSSANPRKIMQLMLRSAHKYCTNCSCWNLPDLKSTHSKNTGMYMNIVIKYTTDAIVPKLSGLDFAVAIDVCGCVISTRGLYKLAGNMLADVAYEKGCCVQTRCIDISTQDNKASKRLPLA